MADRVHWSDHQSANSRVVGLMWRPTGYIGVVTSRSTMKWWANGSADRVFWSNDQSANNGVVWIMGRPKGYIGVMTS